MKSSRILRLGYTALLFLVIGSTLSTKAQTQTYYWIGDSSDWNDPNAWSATSDGASVGKVPNQNTAVVFDQTVEDGTSISISQNAECQSIMCSASAISIHISDGSELKVTGDFDLQEQVFFSGVGKIAFEADHAGTWNSGSSIFSGPVSFEGEGYSLDSHLFTQHQSLEIESGWFNTNGNIITCSELLMPAATDINVNGSSIYITQEINVSDDVRVEQDGENILLSDDIPDDQITPGEFEIGYAANRIATCGTAGGQTPFTIEAIVITDYNGEDVSCNGAADGEAFVTVTGGVGPFSFQWVGGDSPGFTQNYPNLGAGTYVVVVTDLGQGIPCADNVEISEPAPITLFSFSYTPPSCDGLCDGIGTPLVVGGVTPYDYSWSTGESTQTSTQLCEGSNTLTVTDLNDCVYDTTLTIELNPIFANVAVTNILCGGSNTGSAVSTPSGGDGGPYTWNWDTGDTDNDITGQPAGDYDLTVSDAGGCSVDTTITILEQPPMVITLDDLQDVSCGGLTDGSISITVTDGTPGYIFSWTGPGGFTSADEDISNLAEGDYDLTVTDANDCIQLASYTITAPPAIVLTLDVSNILCAGDLTGAIDLTIAGGMPGYVVAWTGPGGFTSADEDITNLAAGTYDVTVTDSNDCVMLGSADVTEPTPIDVTPTVTPISCNGADDAAIDIDILGGTAPFQTDWTGPGGYTSTDEDISGLAPGDYDLTVTDDAGCVFMTTITIDDTPPIDVAFDIVEISCANAADGEIDATISGGTPPYQTDWTGPGGFTSTDEDLSGLDAGQYELTVTDDQGCQVIHEVVLNEPLDITVVEVITDVSCGGLADGEIEISILGGTPPYQTDWTGPGGFTSTDEDITGLEAGDYDLTITDDSGCQLMTSFSVNEPPVLDLTLDVTDITCNGADDGAIDLTISGGQPPYTVGWSGPGGFTSPDEDITDLAPGTYDLLVTDLNGCFAIASADITEPPAMDVTVDVTDPTCFGLTDGSIDLTISGGQPPYDILWNTGDNGTSLTDIGAGDYDVTITDDNGCQVIIDPITVSEPDELVLTLDDTDIMCNGDDDGEITLTISGGTPVYTVSWTGPNGFTSSDLVLTNLEAGTYDVTVTDANDCVTMGSVEIEEPTLLALDAAITEIMCNGDLGAIDLTITGGIEPYDIVWTGPGGFGSVNEDISDLQPGTYDVDVTDDNGCMASASYNLIEPPALDVAETIADLDCSGDDNGSIEIEISGGTPPYSVVWTGPDAFTSNDEDIFDLAEGTYNLTVGDDNGCTFDASYEVSQPELLDVVADIIPPLCAGDPTGSIDITVTGGVPGYTFSWTGPNGFTSPSEDISNLQPGDYTLHIDDSGGCVYDATYTVDEASGIVVDVDATHVGCAGEATGSIDITISGGMPPYNIGWSGPGGFVSTDEDLVNLEAGDYDLAVLDANFCLEQLTVTIDDGAVVDITTSVVNSACGLSDGEATVTIIGATDPVTIIWQDALMNVLGSDPTVTGLAAGQYTVSVVDGNNCGGIFTVDVSDTDVADVEASITDVLCFGDFNGAIDLTVTNGTEPYTFSWTGPNGFTSDAEDIADLEAGDYSINIIDGVGCEINETYPVGSPDEMVLAFTTQDIYCNGENTGTIDLEIFGGTPDYIISWTGPDAFTSNDEDLTDLAPGVYDVTVTDANTCVAVGQVEIFESSELGLTIDATPFLCFGDNSGQIDITVIGGTIPYTFDWAGPNSFVSSNEDLTDLEAGDYVLNLIDDLGCSVDTTVTIAANSEIVIDLDVNQPSCLSANGSLEANVSGGVVATDYSYFWYDVSGGSVLVGTDALLTGLSSGQFYFEVFDDLGCMSSMDITLSDADGSIDGNVQDVLCAGGNNGTIDITVNGGNPDFDYDWSGPSSYSSTDEDIMDLIAGDYTVTVTDDLGCIYSEIFTVDQPDSLQVSFVAGNISCPGDANGQILTSITGGTEPYTVSWTGPDGFTSSSENLSDLEGGCYDITVTDANFCVTTGQQCINEPAELALEAELTHIECFGEATGEIALDVQGGTPFYTYTWVGPGFTSDVEDLEELVAGQYDLQLTDQAGCMLDTMFVIDENSEILLSFAMTSPSCPGDSNGTILADAEGGIGPYDYEWTDGVDIIGTDPGLSDLAAGTYTVGVTDFLGCLVIEDVTLDDPDSIDADAMVNDISCFGEGDGSIEIDILGGTAPFQTDWTGPNTYTSSDEDIFNLEEGSYQLIITDLYLCTDTFQLQIDEPGMIDVSIEDLVNTSCPDSQDGSISINVVGGEPDYDFAWTANNGFSSTDEDITNLDPGTYDLIVQDANGCQVTLNAIPLIFLGDVTAFGPEDMSDCVDAAPWVLEGENEGGLVEMWLDTAGTVLSGDSLLNLTLDPGTYQFIYQAIDGPCVDQDTVEVVVWGLPDVDAGEDQDVFVDEPTELGGDPTTDTEFDALWTVGELLDDSTAFNPMTIGFNVTTEFVVTVTDLNGCMNSDTIVVNIIPEIDVPSGFTPNSDGQNDMWEISNVSFYQNTVVEIYSRWGDLMYRSEGVFQPWDGTYEDNPLPIGTYYYVININEPEFPDPLTGPVTILR